MLNCAIAYRTFHHRVYLLLHRISVKPLVLTRALHRIANDRFVSVQQYSRRREEGREGKKGGRL